MIAEKGRRLRNLWWRVVATTLFLVAPACQGATETEGALPRWTVASEPTVVIGGEDQRPNYLLYRVVDARRLSDGSIVIANFGTTELLVYSAEGEYLRAMGGPGDAPGEMRSLLQIEVVAKDSILAFSTRPGLTWFAPDGGVRTRSLNLFESGVDCRSAEGNWLIFPDGSLLSVLSEVAQAGCSGRAPGPWRASGLLVRTDWRTGEAQEIGIFPESEYSAGWPRPLGGTLAIADEVGMLWVMAYPQGTTALFPKLLQGPWSYEVAPGGALWRVLDAQGHIAVEVRTPEQVYPLEIGPDYVLGLRKDSLEVESVVLYELVR